MHHVASRTRPDVGVPPVGGWGLTVVTGASSGIGREMACALAGRGVPLLLSSRDAGALEQTGTACASNGVHPGTVAADLEQATVRTGVVAIAEGAERLGGASSLIACAGLGWAGPMELTPVDAIERLVSVNVTAPLLLTRALLPRMLASGGGRIVLVGSIAGAVGVAGEAVYSGTKAALVGFADALRAEVARRGISVTLALPGPVDTAFFARRGSPYARRHPAPAAPAEVAAVILAAARAGRAQVYVPGWLSIAARIRGAAPGTYRQLAERWG